MSRSLNKVMLIGHVGKDPEVNFTPSGIPVATFSMATTEGWKDKDGHFQEKTEWHTIVAWRGLAEIAQRHVHKGSKIYVEGRIQSRNFDDKDGNRRYFTEISADNIILLDSRQRNDATPTEGQTPNQANDATAHPNDDIPF
ncbi:MAG: single-stranded DNA-binding protein [Bacteroidetes bacterium]|nr:single-stranded DNA-binding protein [Bacteroidota bacterium]